MLPESNVNVSTYLSTIGLIRIIRSTAASTIPVVHTIRTDQRYSSIASIVKRSAALYEEVNIHSVLAPQAFKKEMAAQKVLYRGFGSQKPGGMLSNFMDQA